MVDKARAVDVAKDISAKPDSIEFDRRRSSGACDFWHDGVVHANRLPDDMKIVGFGTGWFAIDDE